MSLGLRVAGFGVQSLRVTSQAMLTFLVSGAGVQRSELGLLPHCCSSDSGMVAACGTQDARVYPPPHQQGTCKGQLVDQSSVERAQMGLRGSLGRVV